MVNVPYCPVYIGSLESKLKCNRLSIPTFSSWDSGKNFYSAKNCAEQ